MFQDYGKQIWRLSGIGLILCLLTIFTVAALALLLPPTLQASETPHAVVAHLPKAKTAATVPGFLDPKSGTVWKVNSDGNYRIQTLTRQGPNGSPVLGRQRSVLMGIEREPGMALRPIGHYITLNAIGDCFVIPANIVRIIPSGVNSRDIIEIGRVGARHVLQALAAGYYRIEIDTLDDSNRWFDVFVSPVPSFHLDRSDRDWYLTQWNTETTSNCGPTAAAMAVRWASDAQPGVLDIRQYLGWNGDGAVSMEDLQDALSPYKVKSRLMNLNSPKDIFTALDNGHLVAVAYNMAGLQGVNQPESNFMGQYYNDHGGHYLVLKGYSLDHNWFIVYDPIPSDWAENRLRYADGVSMIGRNRYYDTNDLWQALRSNQGLEILR